MPLLVTFFHFFIPALLLAVHAHERGQEYTYLSMFVKAQTPDMVGGDNHLGQLYDQFSLHARQAAKSSEPHREQREPEQFSFNSKTNLHHTPAIHPQTTTSRIRLPLHTVRHQKVDEDPLTDDLSPDEVGDDEDEDEDEDDSPDEQPPTLPHKERFAANGLSNSPPSVDNLSKQYAQKYGENLDRVQMMLLKLILHYDIKSMADIPCRAHAHWMPLFLEKIVAEDPDFVYYCVDTSKSVLKSVKDTIGSTVKSKFVLRQFWREGIPRADMVFSWAGLDNMKEQNVVSYLRRLSKTGKKHKLIAVGTHTGVLEKKGSAEEIERYTAGGKPIHVRKRPFSLKKPMRIIGDLATKGNDKQLYLYRAEDMK